MKALTFTFTFTFFFASLCFAIPTHLDKTKVSTGCRTCHKGHGTRGTTLLESSKENLCFKCHGGSGKGKDVYSLLAKPSNHPVSQTSRYHVTGEELPERDASLPRHASCYDCHNTHRSEKETPLNGMKGYSGRGAKVRQINREFELCYNCHSDSANLPQQKNIAEAFSPLNASYHPVETYGKNSLVPSLKKGYTASSLIRCSDCHGNDDLAGAKGPHGSIYAPILMDRYERTSGPESPATYGLCYQCHNRTSILNDESFKAHKAHIVFNQTPCSDCHDAHGSKLYKNLLTLEGSTFTKTAASAAIYPNSRGELTLLQGASGKPRCFLSCHVKGRAFDHRIGAAAGEETLRATPAPRSKLSLSRMPMTTPAPAPSASQSLQYCVNNKCLKDW